MTLTLADIAKNGYPTCFLAMSAKKIYIANASAIVKSSV